MKLLYLLTMFMLYLELILIKKDENKQNFIVVFIYTFGIIYFFNLFIAVILSYLNIKNILLFFSMIYLFLTFVIYMYFKKKYNKLMFQKYYLNKKELLILLFVIIICFVVGTIRYSYNFSQVKYEIGDSAVHYKMSLEYSKYQKVFFNYHKNNVINYDYPMLGYYVPCGMFMEIMPFSEIVSYNIFNTMILCFISCCFYATILMKKKEDKKSIFTFIFVMLYTLAYPLNNMLYGFGYLGAGIIASNLIIMTFDFISKSKMKMLYFFLLLFNFGLFFSYYLFVPFVYLSEFIYLLYLLKMKKYKLLSFLKIVIICLVIPTIFGYLFFIGNSAISTSLKKYSIIGESYQDLVGNFILLFPLLAHSLYEQVKQEKVDFDLVFLVVLLFYIVITFMLIGTGLMSSYYFYKSYFILWMIVYIFIFKLFNYEKYNVTIKIQYLLIIIVMFFSFYDIEKDVNKVNTDFKYSGAFLKLADIYVYNKEKISNPLINLSSERIELINNTIKNRTQCGLSDKRKDLPYISSYYHQVWYYMMIEYLPTLKYVNYLSLQGINYKTDEIEFNFDSNKNFGTSDKEINDLNYDIFLNYDNLKCMVVDNDSIKDLKKHSFDNDYDVLFENRAGKLYKKK